MHFTIFVYGTWGDIRPHVVLGMGLQRAGHQVQVVASRVYEAWVRARGLAYHPLQTDTNLFTRQNAALLDAGILRQMQMARQKLNPIMAEMAREVLAATRQSDVLLTVEFGAALLFGVLQANQLKTILINPAPLNPTSQLSTVLPPAPTWFPFRSRYNRMGYGIMRRAGWMMMDGPRRAVAAQHPPASAGRYRQYAALLDATPALTTVSPQVVAPPTDWPAHHRMTGYLFDDDPDWTPPPALTAFIEAGEPPVYIGFGSMPDSRPQHTTRLIVEAVQRSGKRAVLLRGWAGLGAADLPPNLYLLGYAPHHWLFPRMAGLIHHGGAGTTASGLRAGKPAVIIPFSADQPFWGRHLHQLGVAGPPIPRKALTVEALTRAIHTVTEDPTLQANARALSEKIAHEDGLGEALRSIAQFIAPWPSKG